MIEIILKFLEISIWPIFGVIIILVLKKPIKNLIPLVKNIKYKDFEVEFSEAFNLIKEEAEESGFNIDKKLKEIKVNDTLLEISPNNFVIESWKELEIACRKKVEKLSINENRFKNPIQRPFIYLENKGALTPSTARTIRNLQNIRNKIVHTNTMEIKRKEAIEYRVIIEEMLKIIEAINELPKLKLTALTIFILEINHIVDTGNYWDISIEEIHKVINDKSLIKFLIERTGEDGDFSLFGKDGPYFEYMDTIIEELNQIYGGYAGQERRKWGVSNSGLCLLIAWINEIIQRGAGWYPNV